MVEIERLSEFERDLKSLTKKYKTLPDDLDVLEKVLKVRPDSNPPYSYRIDGLGIESCVIKVKKIASRSFKGRGVNSGLRLVYAYFQAEKRIVYIEIYHKNDKELEDRARIKAHFK